MHFKQIQLKAFQTNPIKGISKHFKQFQLSGKQLFQIFQTSFPKSNLEVTFKHSCGNFAATVSNVFNFVFRRPTIIWFNWEIEKKMFKNTSTNESVLVGHKNMSDENMEIELWTRGSLPDGKIMKLCMDKFRSSLSPPPPLHRWKPWGLFCH